MALLILLSISLLFGQPSDATGPRPLQLTFFGSSTCDECMRIKEQLLNPLIKQYGRDLQIRIYDTESDSGLRALLGFEKTFKISSSAAQVLFFPDTFLSGYDDIMRLGRVMTEERLLKTPAASFSHDISFDSIDLNHSLRSKAFSSAFFFGTLATGLADGVNPCAIATMIFLISFLATKKRKRREILIIGFTYTATVFVTYLAMGLGLKSILEQLRSYHLISSVIRWAAFFAALIVAVLSFKDAVFYHRSKDTSQITLQLPKAVKVQIHRIISGNLGGGSLIAGSVVAGFLVTLLEAICTGQMYVPYIVAMTQHSSLRFAGYLYLIFYNFLFVLPLLIVMVLAYFGLKWTDLAKQTQKRMVVLKILLGLIMTGLAVYLAVGSGFFVQKTH